MTEASKPDKRRVRWKRAVPVLVGTLLVIVLGGWIFCRRLPFPGPYHGQVLDASTERPIEGAVLTAEWSCQDYPMIDGAGTYYIRVAASTEKNGTFELRRPLRRAGLYKNEYCLTVMADGYITAMFFVQEGEGVGQPWPLLDKTARPSLPERMTIKLRPAKPVLLELSKSPDEQYRRVAEEELRKLEHRE